MCADHDTLLGRIAFFIVKYQNFCFALYFHQFIKKGTVRLPSGCGSAVSFFYSYVDINLKILKRLVKRGLMDFDF
jgi:hypothetical protein